MKKIKKKLYQENINTDHISSAINEKCSKLSESIDNADQQKAFLSEIYNHTGELE